MVESSISVVLADDNVEFAQVVEEFLSCQPDMVFAGAAYNGKAAIELIEEARPDVVILDVVMPHLDGLGVMEHIRRADPLRRPRVLVISAIAMGSTVSSLFSTGADYYLAKPFDLEVLATRIRQLAALPLDRPSGCGARSAVCGAADRVPGAGVGIIGGHGIEARAGTATAPAPGAGPDAGFGGITKIDREACVVELEVSRALREMGVPSCLNGYVYLRDAIMFVLSQGGMLASITRVVYPSVAEKHNTTASRVERSMRHAIETAWTRGDIDTLNEVFGHTVDAEKGRPTNSAFIARIADKIRLDRKTAK